MTISLVSLLDTFLTWMNRTNETISAVNGLVTGNTIVANSGISGNLFTITSNNSGIVITNSRPNVNTTVFIDTTPSLRANDTSVANIASANLVNSNYQSLISAYGAANIAYGQGNTAFNYANTAANNANIAYGQANVAYNRSNVAYNLIGLTGLIAETSANVYAGRTLLGPTSGLSITNPDGIAGHPTFAFTNDLLALETLSSTGIAVRSATDTWVQRSVATANAGLIVTNGNGVGGNPTLALANDIASIESITSIGGVAKRTANDTWALANTVGSIVTRIFFTSGTYTPTAGMIFCKVEGVGGGGGGGACVEQARPYQGSGGAGGGAGYAWKWYTRAEIGTSKAVVIGTGGQGGIYAVIHGQAGTYTTFGGTLLQIPPGSGGINCDVYAGISQPGSGGGMDQPFVGQDGGFYGEIGVFGGNAVLVDGGFIPAGRGGGSGAGWGFGGQNYVNNPYDGVQYGGGGTGAVSLGQSGFIRVNGGAGADGLLVITEYIRP